MTHCGPRNTGRAGAAAVALAWAVLCFPRPAAALAITAPSGPVSMGTVGTVDGGTQISHQLGNVSASDSCLLLCTASFHATVTLTVTFKTGGGVGPESIPTANVKYWSGTASSASGGCTAGQPTSAQAQDLTVPRAAYSCDGSGLLLKSVNATWNPTIVITLPGALVAATYTATITHSAA